MIGDGILFYLAPRKRCVFVGRAPTANWIQFHAETGGYNVKIERTTGRRPSGRKSRDSARSTATRSKDRTRRKVIEKLNGGPFPDIKFFNMGYINIGGRKVRALRHGMAGAPGTRSMGALRRA